MGVSLVVSSIVFDGDCEHVLTDSRNLSHSDHHVFMTYGASHVESCMKIIFLKKYRYTYNLILLVHLDTRTTYTKLTATLTTSNRFLLEVTITAQSVQSKGRQAGAAEKKWETSSGPTRQEDASPPFRDGSHSHPCTTLHHGGNNHNYSYTFIRFVQSPCCSLCIGPTFSLGNPSCMVLAKIIMCHGVSTVWCIIGLPRCTRMRRSLQGS